MVLSASLWEVVPKTGKQQDPRPNPKSNSWPWKKLLHKPSRCVGTEMSRLLAGETDLPHMLFPPGKGMPTKQCFMHFMLHVRCQNVLAYPCRGAISQINLQHRPSVHQIMGTPVKTSNGGSPPFKLTTNRVSSNNKQTQTHTGPATSAFRLG